MLDKSEEIHYNFGTEHGLFEAEQMRGVLWLKDMTKVEDAIVNLYGKPNTADTTQTGLAKVAEN